MSAHIPKVNLWQDWWKPLEEERPATPEPACPALSISKMKAAYYLDVGLEQMVPDQIWIEEECKYDIAAIDKPSKADNDKATAETKAKSMVSVTIQQDMSSIPPMTTLIIDLTSRPESPKVHQLLKATETTTTILPPPSQQQQSTADAMMMKRIG
nr:hypothetical protein [Tanacetum cinerariifolium]